MAIAYHPIMLSQGALEDKDGRTGCLPHPLTIEKRVKMLEGRSSVVVGGFAAALAIISGGVSGFILPSGGGGEGARSSSVHRSLTQSQPIGSRVIMEMNAKVRCCD